MSQPLVANQQCHLILAAAAAAAEPFEIRRYVE